MRYQIPSLDLISAFASLSLMTGLMATSRILFQLYVHDYTDKRSTLSQMATP